MRRRVPGRKGWTDQVTRSVATHRIVVARESFSAHAAGIHKMTTPMLHGGLPRDERSFALVALEKSVDVIVLVRPKPEGVCKDLTAAVAL